MNPPSRALTIVAPLRVDPARTKALSDYLVAVQADLGGEAKTNPGFHPADLPDTHFTRFVIVEDADFDPGDDEHPASPLPALLVWESNHDGTSEAYLRAVVGRCGPAFDDIWGACTGYPGSSDADAFVRWMLAHEIPAAAFYCAYPGVPKVEVDAALTVHAAIVAWLDGQKRAELAAMSQREIKDRILSHLREQGCDLSRHHSPFRELLARLGAYAKLLPILRLLPRIVCLVFRLAGAESTDQPAEFDHPVHGKLDAIAQEDFIRQNQLTHVVDIKPGKLRALVVRSAMRVIDALARGHYVDGNLAGITSIHFARWVILEDKRDVPPAQKRDRLIFFSNYDFSWDSYLGEFVDRAARGLTAAWSSTRGFPRTWLLTEGGARDEERFKQWARDHQIRTNLWWSGVPESTVDNVRNAVWIRRNVSRRMNDAELAEWSRRL